MKHNQFNLYLDKIEIGLDRLLIQNAPALPQNVKKFIVLWIPWLTIIYLIDILLSLYRLLFTDQKISAYVYSSFFDSYIISFIYSISIALFLLMAMMGIFSQKKQAWHYLYIVGIISLFYSLLTLNLAGLMVIIIIALYPLFQVKEFYS